MAEGGKNKRYRANFPSDFFWGCAAWLAFEALNKKEPALMIERIPDT
jgi:hypothetical protein